jgi:hypothetical protein
LGRPDRECCPLASGKRITATVPPNETLKVEFYSPKTPESRAAAAACKQDGRICCEGFGISKGEGIELQDPKGTAIDMKQVVD